MFLKLALKMKAARLLLCHHVCLKVIIVVISARYRLMLSPCATSALGHLLI